jgi:hypothetical protein
MINILALSVVVFSGYVNRLSNIQKTNKQDLTLFRNTGSLLQEILDHMVTRLLYRSFFYLSVRANNFYNR